MVTFRYQELSEAGVPRFPSYVGERIDVAAPRQSAAEAVPVKVKPAGDKRPAPPPPVATPAGARYFEFTGGTSNKFWEVSVSGADVTTRWGRIGTAGQSKTKSFSDAAAAAEQAAKLVEEKTGEGYVEK